MAYLDREHLPGRKASPYELEQIVELQRADLFEKVLIGRLSAFARPFEQRKAKSFALASAVMFGALLDQRVWDEFLCVACSPVLDFKTIRPDRGAQFRYIPTSDRIWIDFALPTVGSKPHARRWVADPLTHLILLKYQSAARHNRILSPEIVQSDTMDWGDVYHSNSRRDLNRAFKSEPSSRPSSDDLDHTDPLNSVDALAIAMGADNWRPNRQQALADSFYSAAKIKWRTRMPGFLFENLLEEGKSSNLTKECWDRLIGLEPKPLPKRECTRNNSRSQNDPARTVYTNPALALLNRLLPSSPASRPREFRIAASQIMEKARQNERIPFQRYLLIWAATRLDPSIDSRQRQRRLAPSTIKSRARALFPLLQQTMQSSSFEAIDAEKLAASLSSSIGDEKDNARLRAAVWCFLDWQNRWNPSFALEIADPPNSKKDLPRASIITAPEYVQILNSFAASNPDGAIARILTILGFRAGLRWREALYLRIADLTFVGSFAELQIRDNTSVRTKSLAGRRVIPLHCLLEASELDEVKSWWLDRRAEVIAKSGVRTRQRDCTMFEPIGDGFDRRVARVVVDAIRAVTKDDNAVYHDLRHSFGSYLIATLTLPYDVSDDALALPIDRTLVSHERREKIADTLLGNGRRGRNAIHAAGALLGHSGEHSTLASYFHLHDWLAGNYVSRPDTMRAIPTELASRLLDMSKQSVARAASRKQKRPNNGRAVKCELHSELLRTLPAPKIARLPGIKVDDVPLAKINKRLRNDKGQTIRRGQGAPASANPSIGTVVLTDFLETAERPACNAPRIPAAQSLMIGSEPGWKVLAAFMSAKTHAERDLLRQHPQLVTPYGCSLLEELEGFLAVTTRGRNGCSNLRFTEMPLMDRSRATRPLQPDEIGVLATLYDGFRYVSPQDMEVVTSCFLKGYDRVRGFISVPLSACHAFADAVIKAGIGQDEINIEERARTALVRFGASGKMHRGYVWGILFASAAHNAVSRLAGPA
ncbi:site-specific integrase [Novosphingopyxis iocasae]|uniref:site-specific integrase n=1 Tax=Novosphingopyxis iocasae TaxID=2762729 RepID=UPI0016515C9B|nr:site-specific integrase [Novosphingopyxis iocasae]